MNWKANLGSVVKEHNLKLEETLDIEYLEKEQIGGKLLVFRA